MRLGRYLIALLIVSAGVACSEDEPGSRAEGPMPSEEPGAAGPPSSDDQNLPPFVAAEIPVGDGPGYVTVAAGSVWVGNHPGQTISRVDPETDGVVATIETKGEPTSMHSGFGLVWTHTVLTGRKLTGIDPASNEIVVQTAYRGEGGSINGIASGAGSIWFTPGNGTVMRVDPRSGKVLAQVKVGGSGPGSVTFGAGAAWYANQDQFLWRIDAATNSPQKIVVGGVAWNPEFGSGAVWVPLTSTGVIVKVDPATGKLIDKLKVGLAVEQVRVTHNRLWVRASDTELVQVDARDLKVIERYELPSASIPGGGLAVGLGSVWVTNFTENTIWRIDPAA